MNEGLLRMPAQASSGNGGAAPAGLQVQRGGLQQLSPQQSPAGRSSSRRSRARRTRRRRRSSCRRCLASMQQQQAATSQQQMQARPHPPCVHSEERQVTLEVCCGWRVCDCWHGGAGMALTAVSLHGEQGWQAGNLLQALQLQMGGGWACPDADPAAAGAAAGEPGGPPPRRAGRRRGRGGAARGAAAAAAGPAEGAPQETEDAGADSGLTADGLSP